MTNNKFVIRSHFDGVDFSLSNAPYSDVEYGEDYIDDNRLMKKCVDGEDQLIVSIDDDDIETVSEII